MRLICVVALLISLTWYGGKCNVVVQPFIDYGQYEYTTFGPDTTAPLAKETNEETAAKAIVNTTTSTTVKTVTTAAKKEPATTPETIPDADFERTTEDIMDVLDLLFTTDIPEATTNFDWLDYTTEAEEIINEANIIKEAEIIKETGVINEVNNMDIAATTEDQINFFDYTEYWTTDSGVVIGGLPIGAAWSIWDEAWIWIVIAILILVFVILIPATIIAICCCGCCRCQQNPRDEKDPDALSVHREGEREHVPIYESFPVSNDEESPQDHDDKDEDEKEEKAPEEPSPPEEKKSDIETVKSIVIDIPDPLKDRPISPLSTDTEEHKPAETLKHLKSPSKANSFSAPKPQAYVDYPKMHKASSVGSELNKSPTEVKIDIGNEAIIGSSAFFPTNPKREVRKVEKDKEPTPKKRHTVSPDRRDHKRASRHHKEPEKRRKRRSDERRKKPTSDIKHEKKKKHIESKQMQLLKTANSIEDLIEAITKFTQEHPIPDSYKEPLKPIKLNQERMREHNRKTAQKPPRRPRDDSCDRKRDKGRERVDKNKDPKARPRARDSSRPNDRTAVWAKQQQSMRENKKPKDKEPRRREKQPQEKERKRREKPKEEPISQKPTMVETQPEAKDSKEEYAAEQRRKQLERDLKKMKKYCNKVIPTEEDTNTPVPVAT